jgi:uncharacterized protein YbcI
MLDTHVDIDLSNDRQLIMNSWDKKIEKKKKKLLPIVFF